MSSEDVKRGLHARLSALKLKIPSSENASEPLPKKKAGKGLSFGSSFLRKLFRGSGSGSGSGNLQPSLSPSSGNVIPEAINVGSPPPTGGESFGATDFCAHAFPVRSHASMPHLALAAGGRSGLPQISVSGAPSGRANPSSSSTDLLQLPPVHAWGPWAPSLSSGGAQDSGCTTPVPTSQGHTLRSCTSAVSACPLTPPAPMPWRPGPMTPSPQASTTSLSTRAAYQVAMSRNASRSTRSMDYPVAAAAKVASAIALGQGHQAAQLPATPVPTRVPPSAPSASFAPMPPSPPVAAAANSLPPPVAAAASSPSPSDCRERSNSSASGANPTLLAVGAGAPASMRRPVWRLGDYEVSGRLYRGDFSSVYKATCQASGVKVVLKVYDLQRVPENALHTLVREIRIHSALSHDAILQLYGVFEESERLVLVLERAARGDLFSLHRRLPGCRMSEDQARGVVLVPLLEALVYCHARGVCHRDIKPENLLLTADWQLRVGDFGAAIDLAQERAVTRTGTVDYMAPEVVRCPLKAAPEDNKDVPELAYTTAADVWSVGVLAFEMLVGFPPFIRLDCGRRVPAAMGALGAARAEGSSEVSFPHFVSAGGQDFISLALAERPEERPTAVQLLRHPWLKHFLRSARVGRSHQKAAAGAPSGPSQRAAPTPSPLSSSRLATVGSAGAPPSQPLQQLQPAPALALSPSLSHHRMAPAASPPSTSQRLAAVAPSGSGSGSGSSQQLQPVPVPVPQSVLHLAQMQALSPRLARQAHSAASSTHSQTRQVAPGSEAP